MIQVEYKGETSRARKLNYAQIDDRRKASKEKLFSGEYTPWQYFPNQQSRWETIVDLEMVLSVKCYE